jgi:hypothetical protein
MWLTALWKLNSVTLGLSFEREKLGRVVVDGGRSSPVVVGVVAAGKLNPNAPFSIIVNPVRASP